LQPPGVVIAKLPLPADEPYDALIDERVKVQGAAAEKVVAPATLEYGEFPRLL